MTELDRRDFLKLVGVGAGATVAAGCSENVEKLIPYVVQPEEIVPGIATYYASTCRECAAGCGLHVRTREGRPVKLEGNPAHPVNRGALCARGQSAIGRTYHPDRFTQPAKREGNELVPISWDDAIQLLAAQVKEAGAGTVVLGSDPGPTIGAVIDEWIGAVGAQPRLAYEPFAPESLREAAKLAFGVESEPLFDLSKADLVVSLGADAFETWLSPSEHARQWAEARDVATKENGGARFVYVGPRLSMTASSADQWIAAKPGTEGILALALARAAVAAGAGAGARASLGGLLEGFDAARAATATGVDAKTIETLGRALAAAKSPLVLPPGGGLASRRATATCAAVLVLNHLLGAVGKSVTLPPLGAGPHASYKDLLALVDSMKSGAVKVLLVHGADPVYSMPAATGFADELAKVPFVVSFASMADETTAKAHLVLPDHTPLESWGDCAPRAGVRSLVQPTLRPLYDTRALVDTLLDVGRALGEDVAAKLPQGSARTIVEAAWSDTAWREALARGGVFGDAPGGGAPSLAPAVAKLEVAEAPLEGDGDLVLLAHPHPLLYDGRGANLPWLQEVPDPVTKITWTTWAEVSRETAAKLGVELGDVVKIETPAGAIEAPILPRGGIRHDVVAVAVGQGHTVGWFASHAMDGRPGEARGASVVSVLPRATDENGGRAWLCTRAKLTKTGRSRRLPFGQNSDNKRGRMLGEAITLSALLGGGAHAAAETPAVSAGPEDAHGAAAAHDAAHGAAAAHGGEHASHEILLPFDGADDAAPDKAYRWGMTVDLDKCTGCSACVAACYVENNIPIVGEDQVLRGRLMSWLRIERFVGEGTPDLVAARVRYEDSEQLGECDVRHSPTLCQQCGSAPCEPVCPVIATYHNPEGLNGMIYNRCIGTRYCANNCPYKVRKFNWADFNLENWPKPMHLMLNPDVTVRGQGVMEKCTFCVQRIEAARQPAKNEKRPIRDGEVTTACAQSCPTRAITFGNLKDAESQVVKKGKGEKRGYHALHVLNTRPAVTYLSKVIRGPVEG